MDSGAFSQSNPAHQRILYVPFRLALRRFIAPLISRPLLWMAGFALLGVALGVAFTLWLCSGDVLSLSRANPILLLPLILAFLSAYAAFEQRHNPIRWRCYFAFFLTFAFACACAYRMAPPVNDISKVAHIANSLSLRSTGPLRPQFIEVRGIVADFPKRSEFGTQFPLDCMEPYQGRIWVNASANAHLGIGDEISLEMMLSPLSRPSNPGERTRYWSMIGANCWSEGRAVDKLVVLQRGRAMPVERGVGWVRNAIFTRYQNLFRGEGSQQDLAHRPFPAAMAQIVTAMVFGEGGLSQPLPRSIRDDFRVAGLSHLLVASGTQASLLAATILLLFSKVSLRPAAILALTIPVLIFYALVAGSAPSIWRAVIIAVLVTVALCLGRPCDGLSLWGGAILLLLFCEPLIAWSLSFQLTFAATWGLLVLAPFISRLWPVEKRGVLTECLSFTLGAQLATIPISLVHFGSMSIAGIGANFLALPIAAGLIFFGVGGLVFDFLSGVNYFLARLMVDVAQGAADSYASNWQGQPISNWMAISFYMVFCFTLLTFADGFFVLSRKLLEVAITRLRNINWWPILGLLLISVSIAAWRKLMPANGTMRVIVLDVGQGNATLFISPQNRAVLFSGGSDDNRTGVANSVILPALQNLGINRLDAVVLCDANAKNNSALPILLREIPVELVIDATPFANGISAPQAKANPDLYDMAFPEYRATLREAVRQKIKVTPARSNQELQIDGSKIRFIASPRRTGPIRFGFSCEYGGNRVLIAGGLDANSQKPLAQRRDLNCDLLVVGNNGVDGSLSREFVEAISPVAALIPVGRFNREKAPAPTTLRRLDGARAQIFRTDFDGSLNASCNGQNCVVTPAFEWGER
jgi:competence protein ComEC